MEEWTFEEYMDYLYSLSEGMEQKVRDYGIKHGSRGDYVLSPLPRLTDLLDELQDCADEPPEAVEDFSDAQEAEAADRIEEIMEELTRVYHDTLTIRAEFFQKHNEPNPDEEDEEDEDY